jgi:hypothetical protein
MRLERPQSFRRYQFTLDNTDFMLVCEFKRLHLMTRYTARIIALVCVLALLTNGLTHSITCSGGLSSTIASLTGSDTSGDLPDSSKRASIATDHCIGCSMMVIAASVQPVVPDRIAADLPVRRFDEKRPYPPAAETPPPISTI